MNTKSNLPIVSIMIPTYNQVDFISDAILSALSQDYPNKEIIVCDDCSTDGTYDHVKKEFPDKVKIFKNAENLGRVNNYQHILNNLSTGEYAINVDGDDMLLDPQLISKSINLILEHENVMFCQSLKYRLKTPIKVEKFDNDTFKFHEGFDYVYNHYATYWFNHLTSVYNATIARKIDFYRKDVIASDAESLLRLATFGNVILRKERAAFWRDHGDNESSTKDWRKQFFDAKGFVLSVHEFLDANFPEKRKKNKKWKHKVLVQSTFPLLGRNLMRLQLGNFLKIFGSALKTDPFLFIKPYVLKYVLIKAKILKTT